MTRFTAGVILALILADTVISTPARSDDRVVFPDVQVPPCTNEWDGRKPPIDALLRGELKTLCRADLVKARLINANLQQANLDGANLTEAILTHANLSGANLSSANLSEADLTHANLSGARLVVATLTRAMLNNANLSGANLIANLSEAHLMDANLGGANLFGADLSKTILGSANLSDTNLRGANLSGANLSGANLTRTSLVGTNVADSYFGGTDLAEVVFEPQPNTLASVDGIEFARNLSRLTFEGEPTSLVVLRERLAKSGLRDQEREVTFAKMHGQRRAHWNRGPFWRKVEAAFSYIAFELPCGYGLNYGRPLHILFFGLIPAFTVVYTLVLRKQSGAGIWRVWAPDRIRKDEGQAEPERLHWHTAGGGLERRPVHRFLRAFSLAFLLSALSAFQIGWRELNVGNWITRLLPREYTLRATGWVRVVSGIQSLLSVYLLALWVLTYFGRPFE